MGPLFNIKDILGNAMNNTRSFLDQKVADPVQARVADLGAGISQIKPLVSQAFKPVVNYAQAMNRDAEAMKQPTQLGNMQFNQYPGVGQVALNRLAQRANIPQWTKDLTSGLAKQSANFDPTSVGSIVGPFAGVRDIIPKIEAGMIGPLYHGTNLENAKRILQEGLKAGQSKIDTNLMDGVYLSRFPSNSYGYAKDWRPYNEGKATQDQLVNGVLLKINPLKLGKMVVDEDAPQVDFRNLWESINRSRRDSLAPNPLPDYNHLKDPLAMVRQYLLDGFKAPDSAMFDPGSLIDIAQGLSQTDAYKYIKAMPKGQDTLRMLGGDIENPVLWNMMTSGENPAGEGIRHLGTMVYKGDIPPEAISILDDTSAGYKSAGNMMVDFPKAFREEDTVKNVIRNLIMDKIRQNLPLDWWMR